MTFNEWGLVVLAVLVGNLPLVLILLFGLGRQLNVMHDELRELRGKERVFAMDGSSK